MRPMAGEDLSTLAEEQAALRRIASRVASGAAPEDVLAAVLEEVGRLLAVRYARMGRYEPDSTLAVVASWGDAGPAAPRTTLGGKNLATIVFETGLSARVDSYQDASGPLGVAAREAGVRAAVGTPITVEGRLWGVMIAGSRGEEILAADAESRLASFTELVATTIANAESRAGITRLAADQAALRRGGGLGARAGPPGGGVAAGGDAGRARGTAGGRVRGGGRGGRAAAPGRLRGPGPLRARRDDHLPRQLGQDPPRLPRRCPGEAWREERHHAGRADR